MAEFADLVVVGGGTIGGWASVFAKAAGLERVVVLERGLLGMGASSRAAGIVRAQGGTPATVALGRWTVGVLSRPAGGVRDGFRLPRARLPDPRGHRRRRTCRARARRDAARRGARRPLAVARRGRRGRPDARTDRSSRGQLPVDGRRDRPATERPRVLARDAGGGRRAARADGVPRAPPRRVPGRRGRDRRRPDRDRTRAADRRPIAAGGRPAGRAAHPGRRGAPLGRGARGRTRPSPSSACRWCSTSAPGCTGGSRRAGSCSAGATPTSNPARLARSTGRRSSAGASASRGSCR